MDYESTSQEIEPIHKKIHQITETTHYHLNLVIIWEEKEEDYAHLYFPMHCIL